jgi:hypothetical protein
MTVFPRITHVRHVDQHRLELGFNDGNTAQLDLASRVVGRADVFEPLENVDFFRQVRVDTEAGTVVWPNGVDFCPDVLHSLAAGILARH